MSTAAVARDVKLVLSAAAVARVGTNASAVATTAKNIRPKVR
jgi:hypothetical protein